MPWSDGKLAYPEILPDKVQNIQNVMRQYGDEDKPMIFSEMGGCTDANGSFKYIPVVSGQANIPISGCAAFVYSKRGIQAVKTK